jgi:hypothetical protein
MLFERQRLLLTLLEAAGEPVGHTDFQKLLFLYTQECEATPGYDFVPYKFGAFSFTSYADKRKLIKDGFLAEDDQNWKLTEAGCAAARRQAVEPLRVAGFCRRHSRLRVRASLRWAGWKLAAGRHSNPQAGTPTLRDYADYNAETSLHSHQCPTARRAPGGKAEG